MATKSMGEEKKFLFGILESCNPLMDFWTGSGWGLGGIRIGLKAAVLCVFSEMGSGRKGRMPNASCEGGQALEKAQNGNGQLLEKVGMDLGLAPRRLGFGATSFGAWRLGSGVDSQRDKSDRDRSDPATGSGAARLYCAASALHPELIARQERRLAAVGLSLCFPRRFDKTAIQGTRTRARQSLRETRTG